jgi:hypothetical protein
VMSSVKSFMDASGSKGHGNMPDAPGSPALPDPASLTAEERRLLQARAGVPWRAWGPYLSERQWGTVREDYSDSEDAWSYFSHDQARSRAYRWGEDGIAGISDDKQRLCLALALWNERDPILKERLFGLTNAEGNHGEDVKEYYNRSPQDAGLYVLPTLWFRNTWSWGDRDPKPRITRVPGPGSADPVVRAEHHQLGVFYLYAQPKATLLFCENETNAARIPGSEQTTRFPKDGIGDHLLHGAGTVNPDGEEPRWRRRSGWPGRPAARRRCSIPCSRTGNGRWPGRTGASPRHPCPTSPRLAKPVAAPNRGYLCPASREGDRVTPQPAARRAPRAPRPRSAAARRPWPAPSPRPGRRPRRRPAPRPRARPAPPRCPASSCRSPG